MDKKITPSDAKDMLDFYSAMDKPRKNFIMRNAGMLLETAYGTHRTITVSKRSPLYLYRDISRYKNPTIVLEGVDNDPLVENSYYQLLNAVLTNNLPDSLFYDILREPITSVAVYISKVIDLEEWYKRNPSAGNGNTEAIIFSMYMYMAQSLATAYKIPDSNYIINHTDIGSADMFVFILNTINKAILHPDNSDLSKLSDSIDSFYETITGCSPEQNSVLVSLIRKYGLKYVSGNTDTRFNDLMKNHNDLKPVPSTRVRCDDLYKIVDTLDRSNIPRMIQKMNSFKKWADEDKILNSNTVIDVMPDRGRYFNNAIIGLLKDDLPFITAATDSRVIPVRSGTSSRYYHFIMKNDKPLMLYKLLPVDGGESRYFAISLDPENEVFGEITKESEVKTEFVCESPNKALSSFFTE